MARAAWIIVYALGTTLSLAGHLAYPRLAASAAAGPAAYYALYLAMLAAGAAAALVLYRLASPRAPLCRRASLCLAPPAAALAAYAAMTLVIGWTRTPIAGLKGSMLAYTAAALAAAPAALAAASTPQGRPYSIPLAALAGVAALSPRALTPPWGDPAALAASLTAGGAVGYLAHRAAGAGPLAALLAAPPLIAAAAGLPYTVSHGAIGLALALLAAAYAGLAAIDLAEPPPTPRPMEAPPPGRRPSRRAPTALALALAAVAALALALTASGVMIWKPVVILTGSMEPTLAPGDLVILKRPDTITPGDIVTYNRNGVLVTHRVIEEVEPGVYKTKGDANTEPDPYNVTSNMIIGKLWAKIPKIGWITILANWNQAVRIGLMVAVLLLALALAYNASRSTKEPPADRPADATASEGDGVKE